MNEHLAAGSQRLRAAPGGLPVLTKAKRHGSTVIGERRTSARHRVEGSLLTTDTRLHRFVKPDRDRFLRRWTRSFTIARVESSKERSSPPGAASGRKWRIRAPHIMPNPSRGATNATSIAVVKLARTPSDRRLATRRVSSDTCVASARVKTSCSKALYATSMHTNTPA